MTPRYRAMLVRRLGPPEVLELAELPRRTLRSGEVRVAVRAAGVNFPDLLQVAGEYQHKPPLPFVPGFEAAGEITEIAPDVAGWRTGDAVLLRGTASYAEEMIAPAAALLPKPADWSWAEAAAFPVCAGTAWIALLWRGRLQPGETLLVLGAGGGTGLAAVALGVQSGARVIAVASSPEKRAGRTTGRRCAVHRSRGRRLGDECTGGRGLRSGRRQPLRHRLARAQTRWTLAGDRFCRPRFSAAGSQPPAAAGSRTDRRARRRTDPPRARGGRSTGSRFAEMASRRRASSAAGRRSLPA